MPVCPVCITGLNHSPREHWPVSPRDSPETTHSGMWGNKRNGPGLDRLESLSKNRCNFIIVICFFLMIIIIKLLAATSVV